MKNFYLVATLFIVFSLSAQKENQHCGADQLHFELSKEDLDYKKRFDLMNLEWQELAPKYQEEKNRQLKGSKNRLSSPITTLTVVFHDLSAGNTFLLPNTSSINDYQYIVGKLNLIFDGTNLGGKPVGNDTSIQFCLAKIKQNGDTYTIASNQYSNLAFAANVNKYDADQLEDIVNATTSQTRFNTSKYINVYIVDNMVGGVAAFATSPASHGTPRDGIYIERQYLVNNASLDYNMNVLAHEMGHYLGLLHTFGLCETPTSGIDYDCSCDNNNCLFNGDMVCDTPPNRLQSSGYGATTFPNTCNTDALAYLDPLTGTNLNPITSDVNDPKDNYMDYGNWNFQYLFTPGQIVRMQFMIDPLYGPRKTLLGQSACEDCSLLNNCTFNIVPTPALVSPRFEITQVGTTTPTVQFNMTGNCVTNLGTQLSYIWKLVDLNTNALINQGTTSSYTTSGSLAVGNYKLTLTASLITNPLCSESATYNFTVIPQAGTCNLVLPSANTALDWSSALWNRRSLKDGWYYNGTSYPSGSSQYNDNQVGLFDNTGFDVVSIIPGGSIGGSDTLLGGINLPLEANINSVMRVGKPTGSGGTAYYAKRTITVNRNNCKFKVWVLGATQGTSFNYLPFNNVYQWITSIDSGFGIMSLYKYSSPVNGPSTAYNSTIGYSDTVSIHKTEHNQIASLINANGLPSGGFVQEGIFKRMTGWKSFILDYSEYVDLNPETEITLTFFSHSNNAIDAQQNAYAYYGIECLGGGIPTDYTIDIPDTSVGCSSPGTRSCVDIPIPRTSYQISTGKVILRNDPDWKFENIKVYKIDQITGIPSSSPYPIEFIESETKMRICLSGEDAPFQDFRLVATTFHKTVVDDFRLYVGFYNTIPDCTTGDVIDESFHPGLTNGDMLLCGTDNLPSLHLTPTCISSEFSYQWYRKNEINVGLEYYPIEGATSDTLQLAYNPTVNWSYTQPSLSNNYNPSTCNTYIRQVIYREPYCQNIKIKTSQKFSIYNKSSIQLRYANAVDNDICFGSTYNLNVISPSLNNNLPNVNSCTLPAHLAAEFSNVTNTLSFQLFDPASNQLIGNVISHTFTGAFTNGGSIPGLNLNFTFDNINPSTGNTPLFIPTTSNTIFPISIRIWGNYLGCPIIGEEHTSPIQTIGFNLSAVGGKIAYSCSSGVGITSIDDGATYGGYTWEYSTDYNNFIVINGAIGNTLSQSEITALGVSNPIYIRRKSNGTGECMQPQYSNIVIITSSPSNIVFSTLPATICKGSTVPTLPTVSTNGVIGVWNVETVSNQNNAVYLFTPLEGYCLSPYEYELTVLDVVIPDFLQIAPICAGENLILPSNSINGITGSWTPAVNNMITTSYTFVADAVNSCTTQASMVVEVSPVTLLDFSTRAFVFNPLCYGAQPPALPTTDDNGVTGIWNPPFINNNLSADYTFTPDNTCISPETYSISIIQNCGFTLSWGSEVSCQLSDYKEKYSESIVDGACLRVCENSQVSYQLHGNISMIDHTDWNITGGTLISQTNSSCVIEWNTGSSFCALQGVIYLTNGLQININRCIEKLEAPIASFGVYPHPEGVEYVTCVGAPTFFENYSLTNNGDNNLSYNWYFGDGNTSNEFEPTHIYNNTGSYEVTLTVYNGCSCVAQLKQKVIVEKGHIKINCLSVACEGDLATYSIDSSYQECTNLSWQVEGGIIVDQQNNNTQIKVLWDSVGQDGFGYVTLNPSSCGACSSTIKVPIVKNIGTIKGDLFTCEKSQNLYSLPQWPSTDFTWTLDDNGTGATLTLNNQRNEVYINSNLAGTIVLKCSYINTLLGCRGTASLTIKVQPSMQIEGTIEACQFATGMYEILDASGNTPSSVSWIVTGPSLYEQTGTVNPFTVSFPLPGIYYVTTQDPDFCNSKYYEVKVSKSPEAPSNINGSSTICPGTPYTYTCLPLTGYTTHWYVTNGTILGSAVGNSVSVNFNPLATTPYVLQVWYEKDGCISEKFTKVLYREVPNLAVINSDTTVCGSSFANYAVSDTTSENYIWSINPPTAGSIETGQNSSSITVLWNQQPQTATISLQVRKCGKFYNMNPINVTIINAPEITISGSNAICSGQSANFSFSQVPSGFFESVIWDFGDGTTFVSTESNTASHQYQTPVDGSVSYTVTATVKGGAGCLMPAIASFEIEVSPSPTVAITPNSSMNICGIAIFDHIYTVTMQGGFASTDSIEWYKNGILIQSGAASTNASINVFVHGIGNYYAVIENIFGCRKATQIVNVYSDCPTCTATEEVEMALTVTGCQSIVAFPAPLPDGYTSVGWSADIPNSTITNSTLEYFAADNIAPGLYTLQLEAYYNGCPATKKKRFIIPYKPNLKYKVSCSTNGTYQVTLLDHSTYYAATPITNYWFSIDNGVNWYSSTVDNGVHQFTSTLSPGTYQVGIKVFRDGYYECQQFIPLSLPSMPSVAFTSPSSVCANSPIAFTVTNPQPGNQYSWNFGDLSYNLQQNPVKTFTIGGEKAITLTVTNEYGCQVTSALHDIFVHSINMSGNVFVTPTTACEGEVMTLNFNSVGELPTQFAWYQNTVTPTPFAVTNSPSLTVNQSGQYFVYLQDNNGCPLYTIPASTVAFKPAPEPPAISCSNAVVCAKTDVTLKVPINLTVNYLWSLNGVPQPQWDNHSSVTTSHDLPGQYTYSVVARVLAGSSSCYSEPSSFTIDVIALPDVPVLSQGTLSCEPYQVEIVIDNPQPDAGYYWSNGDTGSSTIMWHDGPLQVRAVLNECFSKNQINLPLDLGPLSWIFPKGCYQNCKKPEGYIIGPMAELAEWQWLENDYPVSSGVGVMSPFAGLNNSSTYSMLLSNDVCGLMAGNLTYEVIDCKECEFGIEKKDVKCVNINGQVVYQISFGFGNPYSNTIYASLSTPNNEGYFTNNNMIIPVGSSVQTFYFNANTGFSSGTVELLVTAQLDGKTCVQKISLELFPECETIPKCKFEYRFSKESCVKTPTGNIYSFSLEILNPYPLDALTSISVPFGTITPANLTTTSGVSSNHFYYYPPVGFGGGVLPLTILSSIGSVVCEKSFEMILPTDCPEVEKCDFDLKKAEVVCKLLPNGQQGYRIFMDIYNPYSTATITFTAIDGQGYFMPDTITLGAGSTSSHVIDFYPATGFYGGAIRVRMEGHYENQICLINIPRFVFPPLCCSTCRIAESPTNTNGLTKLLLVAPNPTTANSTIFYNFANLKGKKELQMTDLLGRTLQSWSFQEAEGSLYFDCSRYAQGHYLIVMKADGIIVASTKLIKN